VDELSLYKIDAYGDTTTRRNKTLQEEILRVNKLHKFSDNAAFNPPLPHRMSTRGPPGTPDTPASPCNFFVDFKQL